jgi:hypothetical protein
MEEQKIDEQLNNLAVVRIPAELHQSVMLRVGYGKIKPALFVVFVLFAVNFLIIVLRINAKLIDADFLDMIKDLLDVFNFNFSFISTITSSFFEIVSPSLVLYALLCFAGSVYLAIKMGSMSSFKFNKI